MSAVCRAAFDAHAELLLQLIQNYVLRHCIIIIVKNTVLQRVNSIMQNTNFESQFSAVSFNSLISKYSSTPA
jgi:hypothetical protein